MNDKKITDAEAKAVEYQEAIARYKADSAILQVRADVSPGAIQKAIMSFLESVSSDEGGNAARYFPAVLVTRMARHIADELNSQ